MKLLLCVKCSDIRALSDEGWVSCRCGISSARYGKNFRGERKGGKAMLLAFKNPEFIEALRATNEDAEAGRARYFGHRFEAWVIPHSELIDSTHEETSEAEMK